MYKIFKVSLTNTDMDVDLPEGYKIDGVLNSSETSVTLVLKKVEPAVTYNHDYIYQSSQTEPVALTTPPGISFTSSNGRY